jgi:hypothetical protein
MAGRITAWHFTRPNLRETKASPPSANYRMPSHKLFFPECCREVTYSPPWITAASGTAGPSTCPPTDRGASFAAGVKLMLLQKVQLQLAAATPLITPQTVPDNQRWRFVIGTAGQF